MRALQISLIARIAAAALACSVAGAHAAQPVLVQGQHAGITTADVEADALRMPEEMRSQVLARQASVAQIGMNLYVRRVMADEAAKLSLDQQAQVQAALRVARDKVLSDAWLAHLDAQNTVDDKAALAQAKATYEAKPERFKHEEQVRIRHILLDNKDKAAAQATAQEIEKQLRAGTPFDELAGKYSIDKGSAARGGDLGFFEHGRMVPEFEKAAFAMKNPGDLSEATSQFGLHILQLEARRPAGIAPFDEVKDTLAQEVKAKLLQDARVAAADKIRAGATVDEAAVAAFAASHAAPTPAVKK